jgi:TonB family protein
LSTGTTLAPLPFNGPKRKVPRYKLAIPLNLTVLRAGVPDSLRGRTLEIGEGGMGVVVASQLLLGESVRVEFLLPHMTTPVRATAVVRYRHAMCFGLQFLRLPDDQQSIIRYWTRREAEVQLAAPGLETSLTNAALAEKDEDAAPQTPQELKESAFAGQGFRVPRLLLLVICVLGLALSLAWWRWQQGWHELEAPISSKASQVVKPQAQVPADVMRQRLRHEVPPQYPENAQRAGVQGMVVLDAVVSEEGAVIEVKATSGPSSLAEAAIDAVRWWRYDPYVVNGQPVAVQTTIAVNFRLSN